MPNWVHNTLTVTKGDPKTLFEFLRSQESIFDFNKVIPMPARIQNSDEEVEWEGYTTPEWYAWACDNWGTKWNACDARYSTEDPEHEIRFETAWSPPEPVFEALAQRFHDHEIIIRSFEDMNHWHYTFVLKNGEMESTERTCHCFDEHIDSPEGP